MCLLSKPEETKDIYVVLFGQCIHCQKHHKSIIRSIKSKIYYSWNWIVNLFLLSVTVRFQENAGAELETVKNIPMQYDG